MYEGRARRPPAGEAERRGPGSFSRGDTQRLAGLELAGGLLLLLLFVVVAASQWGSPGPLGFAVRSSPAPAPLLVVADAAPAAVVSHAPIVQLQIVASPGAICDGGLGGCPAGAGESTVTMTERAGLPGHNDWPAVQVVFLLETTPYDGVYDPSAGVAGSDPCGDAEVGTATLCDESNAVPFFVANAGAIAEALQAAHPNSSFSFALVDYFATHDGWDDGDGAEDVQLLTVICGRPPA